MGRGRGKGKRGGRGGGGRQHFVSSLEELESRNDRDEAWAARRKAEREDSGESSGDETKKRDDDDGGSEEEGSSEDEGARGGGAAAAAGAVEMKQPKAKGVSSLIEVANPNAKPKAGRMMKAKVREFAQIIPWQWYGARLWLNKRLWAIFLYFHGMRGEAGSRECQWFTSVHGAPLLQPGLHSSRTSMGAPQSSSSSTLCR